jgi:hypothetical protein
VLRTAGGDGSVGFVIDGIGAGERSGNSVSAAGDVNGDGIADLIIGADFNGFAGGVGQAYVVFGRAQPFPPTFPLSNLLPDNGGDGTRGFVLDGTGTPAIALGASVSGG